MNKRLKKFLIAFTAIASALIIATYTFLQHPKFGDIPEGMHNNMISNSPNFKNGKFHNQLPTPLFTEKVSFVSALASYILSGSKHLKPELPIPAIKTDLKALDKNADVVIWLGHSSYFIQIGGKRLLVDPVFSTYASPLPMFNRAFDGTSIYSADDMPDIDCLLITHDHWDHLDYSSIKALEPKIGEVISGLGVGAYFRQWGYPVEKIREADWNTQLDFEQGFSIHVLPARHYSGRFLNKNQTLWVGFVIESPDRKIFMSGDSGYGPHFSEIGENFKHFDLAILDAGQYDKRWALIHMTPEEAIRASVDLNAHAFMPCHVGRFAIARHSWDEPFLRLQAAPYYSKGRLLTPKIGKPVYLADHEQKFSQWWVRDTF